jgi:predicted nucleic acid-binding protein
LVIANVNYLLGRHIGKIPVRNSIKLLMNEVNILSCERSDIEDALNSSFADFEDAIQHSVAKRYNCDVFITRNTKDYKHSAIPVMTAEQFLRTIYKA